MKTCVVAFLALLNMWMWASTSARADAYDTLLLYANRSACAQTIYGSRMDSEWARTEMEKKVQELQKEGRTIIDAQVIPVSHGINYYIINYVPMLPQTITANKLERKAAFEELLQKVAALKTEGACVLDARLVSGGLGENKYKIIYLK